MPRLRSTRSDRRPQSLREEGQACRTWLHPLRALQAPSSAPRRRRHLAQASITAQDQNSVSPLERVEPLISESRAWAPSRPLSLERSGHLNVNIGSLVTNRRTSRRSAEFKGCHGGWLPCARRRSTWHHTQGNWDLAVIHHHHAAGGFVTQPWRSGLQSSPRA
jgi:hypothetical protein